MFAYYLHIYHKIAAKVYSNVYSNNNSYLSFSLQICSTVILGVLFGGGGGVLSEYNATCYIK